MSDWLIQGIAAAKANEKELARFYLERALLELQVSGERYDSGGRYDKTDVYYWLSRITDDPVQKRDYLESVLAINPMHPEARRDLAILDGRLKPEDIVNPDRVTAALTPAETPDADAVRRFVCPNCGGKMTYDVERRALICGYCGHRLSEAEAQQAATARVAEQDFVATIYTARAHKWELPTARTLKCQSCGANFVLPPSQVTGSCPFCGSAHLLESSTTEELIEPQGVVPFQFDVEACIQHIRDWIKTRDFAPDDLYERSAIVKPRPVYLPCWVFDVGGSVGWTGLVEEQRDIDGKIVWVQRSGQELVVHDNIVVPASHTLADDQRDALTDETAAGAYDLTQLAPYSEKYLADWTAEIYQVAMADASLTARQKSFARARGRAASNVVAGARDVSFSSAGIVINTYKLVLLPVWVSAYHYKEKSYPLVVNGQTGAVFGDVPRSGMQRFLSGILGRD